MLFSYFNTFKIDIVEHMFKEENVVFPLIKDYIANEDEQLLSQMRMFNDELEKEHDDSGDILKQIREITNGFELPFGACGTYQVTYARLAELEDMTFEHIHLENNVLFQRLYIRTYEKYDVFISVFRTFFVSSMISIM